MIVWNGEPLPPTIIDKAHADDYIDFITIIESFILFISKRYLLYTKLPFSSADTRPAPCRQALATTQQRPIIKATRTAAESSHKLKPPLCSSHSDDNLNKTYSARAIIELKTNDNYNAVIKEFKISKLRYGICEGGNRKRSVHFITKQRHWTSPVNGFRKTRAFCWLNELERV